LSLYVDGREEAVNEKMPKNPNNASASQFSACYPTAVYIAVDPDKSDSGFSGDLSGLAIFPRELHKIELHHLQALFLGAALPKGVRSC
jgi:hypothetical protein